MKKKVLRMMINATRGDLPLRDEDRKEIDKFKEDIKKSRPDRYNQDKAKKISE